MAIAGGMERVRKAAMAAALVGMVALAMPVGAGVMPQVSWDTGGAMVLRSDGTVWSWGANWSGQIGNGTISQSVSAPTQVVGLSSVRAVAKAESHSLALKTDGTVWAWGSNYYQALGVYSADFHNDRSLFPRRVESLDRIESIQVGMASSFALRDDGTVWSWGWSGAAGTLGDGVPQMPGPLNDADAHWNSARVLLPDGIVAISVAHNHGLALTAQGKVWAWGASDHGQLGVPTIAASPTPIEVPGLRDVTAVFATHLTSFVLKSDGTVWAFGLGRGGELGVGPLEKSSDPVQVQDISELARICGRGPLIVALKRDGTVWAWGSGEIGGLTLDRSRAVRVPSLIQVRDLDCGTTGGVLARPDGVLLTWGENTNGELGNGYNDASYVFHTTSVLSGLVLGKKHPLGNDLTLDFGTGNGIWQRRNNATWAPLHGTPARHMVSADVDFNGRDDLVVDFGPSYGIWVRMNDTDWVGLHGTSAREIARADLDGNGQDDIVIDFGAPHGIWARMNNAGWVRIHGTSARHLTAADLDADGRDDLVVDFGPQYGIWVWMNHRNWVALHGNSAEIITAADMDGNGMADLVIDFGMDFGIWTRMNNATWVGLHGLSTSRPVVTLSGPQSAVVGMSTPQIAAADMDGNGQDDVIIDFGPGHGIWVRMNNASWVPLHGTSAQHIAAADLDGNGKADVVVDFGTASGGIWARMNNATWTQINAVGASSLASGQMDGN